MVCQRCRSDLTQLAEIIAGKAHADSSGERADVERRDLTLGENPVPLAAWSASKVGVQLAYRDMSKDTGVRAAMRRVGIANRMARFLR